MTFNGAVLGFRESVWQVAAHRTVPFNTPLLYGTSLRRPLHSVKSLPNCGFTKC